MKSAEDATKYLLAFLEANFLLNSKNYENLKFYAIMVLYQVTKMSNFAQYWPIVLNFPLCVPPGINIFDPCEMHLWLLSPKIF